MTMLLKLSIAAAIVAILLNLVLLATRVQSQPAIIVECTPTAEQPVGNIIQRRHDALTRL